MVVVQTVRKSGISTPRVWGVRPLSWANALPQSGAFDAVSANVAVWVDRKSSGCFDTQVKLPRHPAPPQWEGLWFMFLSKNSHERKHTMCHPPPRDPVVVLPDRALCVSTFSHLSFVNKHPSSASSETYKLYTSTPNLDYFYSINDIYVHACLPTCRIVKNKKSGISVALKIRSNRATFPIDA